MSVKHTEQVVADMKTCRLCGVEKPLAEFYMHKSGKCGRAGRCKECMKPVKHAWKTRSKEYLLDHSRRPESRATQAAYRTSHVGIEKRKAWRRQQSYELSDWYIKKLLKMPPELITPEIIDLKRQHVLLKRAIKEIS